MVTPRGPQQARSQATHARLIEAAAECLVQKGYAGTSTQAVAQAAGVSQGALFKHFPSKAELLGAAVRHLLSSLFGSFRGELGRRLGGARGGGALERVGPAVGALWAVFRSAELSALLEVYVAARTDAVLEAQLGPALAAHNGQIINEARRLFPEASAHPEFEGAIGAVVYAMQGAAVGLFGPAARDDGANLVFFERLARRELGHLLEGRHGKLDSLFDTGVRRLGRARGAVGAARGAGRRARAGRRRARDGGPGRRLRGARHGDEPLDGHRLRAHLARHQGRLVRAHDVALSAPPHRPAPRVVGLGAFALRRRLLLLLVSPLAPRGAPALGRARQPPLEHALQPVDGAAPIVDDALHEPRLLAAAAALGLRPRVGGGAAGGKPSLPVLAAHRGRGPPRAARAGAEHALAPQGAPRLEPRVPRPKPRRHFYHMG